VGQATYNAAFEAITESPIPNPGQQIVPGDNLKKNRTHLDHAIVIPIQITGTLYNPQ
jgi:hypothetical protein